MAYYTLHAYDADVRIPLFAGIRQDSETANDLRFAAEAVNVETPNGVLQPQAAITQMVSRYVKITPAEESEEESEEESSETQTTEVFEDRIETIATFHRRWYTKAGSRDWYIICAGGKFYQKQADDPGTWSEIELPEDVEAFSKSVWSWVTYEDNLTIGGESVTVDVMLLSNDEDGMIMITPPDRVNTWGDVKTHTWGYWGNHTWSDMKSERWQILEIETPEKFGVIERHAERVWGAAVKDKPDNLYYSAVYDPKDWDENDEHPEKGGGEVMQPTWDGDKFFALKHIGDQLIAFKKNRVFRVTGVSPRQFEFQEQYGGGTEFFNTIGAEGERLYMASVDGLSSYDGMNVSPFQRNFIEKFWRTVNRDAMDQMCAAIHKHRYYLSVPTGNSTVNNAVLMYNFEEGTFLLYKDMYIESLISSGEHLYATSSSLPGKILEIHYNSWETGVSSGKAARWETPWMDFNYMTIAKGGYEIYFMPEVKKYPVTFRFTIQTEKKSKSKTVTIQPTLVKQKQKRIRFGGTSRRFKLIIEALPISTGALWRLTGGIHMVVETDPD